MTPGAWNHCYRQERSCVDAPGHSICLEGCIEGFRPLDDPNDLYKFPQIVQACYNACIRIEPKCYSRLPCGPEYPPRTYTYPRATVFISSPGLPEIGAILIWRCENRRWEILTQAHIRLWPERQELYDNDHFVTLEPYDPEITKFPTEKASYSCIEGSLKEISPGKHELLVFNPFSFTVYIGILTGKRHGTEETGPCPNADIWTAVSIGLGALAVAGVNIEKVQSCVLGFGSPLGGSGDHLIEDLGIAIADCGLNVAVGGRVLGAAEIANAIRTACFR